MLNIPLKELHPENEMQLKSAPLSPRHQKCRGGLIIDDELKLEPRLSRQAGSIQLQTSLKTLKMQGGTEREKLVETLDKENKTSENLKSALCREMGRLQLGALNRQDVFTGKKERERASINSMNQRRHQFPNMKENLSPKHAVRKLSSLIPDHTELKQKLNITKNLKNRYMSGSKGQGLSPSANQDLPYTGKPAKHQSKYHPGEVVNDSMYVFLETQKGYFWTSTPALFMYFFLIVALVFQKPMFLHGITLILTFKIFGIVSSWIKNFDEEIPVHGGKNHFDAIKKRIGIDMRKRTSLLNNRTINHLEHKLE